MDIPEDYHQSREISKTVNEVLIGHLEKGDALEGLYQPGLFSVQAVPQMDYMTHNRTSTCAQGIRV